MHSERAVMAALDLSKNLKKLFKKIEMQNQLDIIKVNTNRSREEYDRDKGKRGAHEGRKMSTVAIGITSGTVYLGLVGGL